MVTLFRPRRGASGLLCLGTFPAWVKCEARVRNSGMGVFQDDRFDIRLKLVHISDILPGDLVFFGRAEAGCVKATECRRIDVVNRNGFGGAPHWHLRSEYRYR